MPPLPAVPNVVKMQMQFFKGNEVHIATNNYFSYSGSAPNASACAAIAGSWQGLANTNLKSLMASGDVLENTYLQDLASSSGADGNSGSPLTGTRSGGSLFGGTALVLNHIIARRYRGGKPKNFLPFGTLTDVYTAQTWQSSFLSAVNTAWAAMMTGFLGTSSGGCTISEHVNVSYYDGFTVVTSPTTGRARNVPKLRSGGPITDVISASSASTRPGSQRRRN
jgi:hypothetical protein